MLVRRHQEMAYLGPTFPSTAVHFLEISLQSGGMPFLLAVIYRYRR